MDLCHLKNSELEPEFQKDKGRAVLRGDVVKDDSGSHAIFKEQGFSASHTKAAKVLDSVFQTTWIPRTRKRRSVSQHPSQNGGRSDIAQASQVRMS